MVLSPWAVRELRFDESLGKLHGYDFDICMQARAAGKKVVTADFRVDPPPLARADQRPRGLDPDLHQAGGEVGRTSFRTRAPTPSSARCAPRPRRRARGRSWSPTRCASRRSGASSPASSESSRAPRAELEATRQELEATSAAARHERPSPTAASTGAAGGAALPARLGRSTTRSTSSGSSRSRAWRSAQAYGQYAFYAIDKPSVGAASSSMSAPGAPRDHLLSAIEQAAERPGMQRARRRLLGSGDGGRDRAGRRGPAVRRAHPHGRPRLGPGARAVRAGHLVAS